MKKFAKKVCSLVLVLSLLCATFAPSAGAAFDPSASVSEQLSPFKKCLYNILDFAVSSLAGVANYVLPDNEAWADKSERDSDGFMLGMSDFLTSPARGAKWSLGYDCASILTGKEIDKNHFVGGGLSIKPKNPTSIMDDLKVRTVALSDNSGRGVAVFAAVDSYGLANTEVRAIRKSLESYCKDHNIVSLNVAVLHQHSAVDTFGLNGNIFRELLNPFTSEKKNGVNKEYNENLRKVVAQSVKSAVENMKTGKLYYGTADFSEFVNDKRDPQVLNTDFDRFRFVPDDGGRETWLTASCVHCVGLGADTTDISGDYPYYAEKVVNEKYNANFMMLLTAEQGTGQDGSSVNKDGSLTEKDYLNAYGTAIAERFASINNETEVKPLLNIRLKETTYKVSNEILVFAAKMGLLTNTVVKSGDDYEVATEIGYMELGDDISVVLIPGECAAELLYGGCLNSDKSWTGDGWNLHPVKDFVGGRRLLAFGVINDQIGYIIPDNDYMSIFSPTGKTLEIVSTGKNTASDMVNDFEELISDCKT